MFCVTGLVFRGTEFVGSRLHVLRARTRYLRYRGRRIPFSCFVRSDSFSAVPWASDPVFMFSPGIIFGVTDIIGSRFHVLRSDSFSEVRSASGPVYMFCATGLIFGGTEDVGSRFHVLRSRTRFRRYRGRQVSFSCFVRSDSPSTVPWAVGAIFMFCAPVLVLRGTEPWGPVFMFCAPGFLYGVTEGIRSRFHVLRSPTHFRLYRGRRVPFPCFARPDSFSAVPSASSPVFMFCAPGLVFGVTEGVGSRFHVLRARTRFRLYRGRRVPFSYFARADYFSAVPRASGLVFMFCTPGIVSAVPRASGPVFMFCALRLVFGITEGVGSRFHVLCARTRFRL
jgi:hypothetical protein